MVRRQKSALHTATSHFYHDSYFRRFLFGLYINIAVGNFPFVVCNIFVLIRLLVARSHCRDSCACMHRSCSGCNTSFSLECFLEDYRDRNRKFKAWTKVAETLQ